MLKGRKVSPNVRVMVVPGSQEIKRQAEAEGLDRVFREAGAEWREAGCSMCIAMNGDQLAAGRVQRLDQQSQLRRPAGQGRAHVPGQPADRRRHRHHRQGHRRRGLGLLMKKFTTFESRMVPLPVDNIDTDQIIPARFLKTISKEGLDKQLFYDWRYDARRQSEPGFHAEPAARRKGAEILLAGDNFGCGSSREHAPWALTQFGFRAVISTSFADIFKGNALKNSLLPIVVPREIHGELFRAVEANPQYTVTVDLAAQKLDLTGRPRGGVPRGRVFQALPARRRGRAWLYPAARGGDRGVRSATSGHGQHPHRSLSSDCSDPRVFGQPAGTRGFSFCWYRLSMQATTLVSVEEYLNSDYQPDCDYVDGVLEERNLGEYNHGRLQMLISHLPACATTIQRHSCCGRATNSGWPDSFSCPRCRCDRRKTHRAGFVSTSAPVCRSAFA